MIFSPMDVDRLLFFPGLKPGVTILYAPDGACSIYNPGSGTVLNSAHYRNLGTGMFGLHFFQSHTGKLPVVLLPSAPSTKLRACFYFCPFTIDHRP